MPGLQVVSQPNQPTLTSTVAQAPNQPALAPNVSSNPVNAPTLAPKVATQPNQPSLSPQVQTTPQGQQDLSVSQGKIIDSITAAKARGADAQAILKAVMDQNPDKQELFQTALQRGATAEQILDKIIQDNHASGSSVGSDTFSPTVGGFAGNVAKSGFGAVKNLLTAVLHPVKTIEGAAKILGGATASTFTLGQKSTPEFDSFITFLKGRYGSVDALKKTAYEDPVGFLIDLSTILDAGASGLAKAGDISKISEITKAGEIASKVADITNPIKIAGKAAGPVLSKAGNAISETLGSITGAGGGAIKEGLANPSEGFYSGLRGNSSPAEIVQESKQALNAAKAERTATYQSQLADIKNAPTKLDISPLKAELTKQLNKFGVQVDGKGNLIFDNSTISDSSDIGKIQQAFDDINRWERSQKNLAPVGVDTLKRRLDNLYSPTSDVRAFTTALKSTAGKILKDNVPGYEQMTKTYQQSTQFIDDVTKGLSLGDKASTDTALRKLSSALKQNNEFRTELVNQLQEIGGKDLTGKIAGYNLSSLIPRSIVGKGADILALYGLAHALNPAMFAALATSSPRLVGEVVGALGIAKQNVSGVIEALQKSGASKIAAPTLKAGYYTKKSQSQ
jgi:hypothetical protein